MELLELGRIQAQFEPSLPAAVPIKLFNSWSTCTEREVHFMASLVAYLGHVIDATGLHPLPDKVQAIQKVPTPFIK